MGALKNLMYLTTYLGSSILDMVFLLRSSFFQKPRISIKCERVVNVKKQ